MAGKKRSSTSQRGKAPTMAASSASGSPGYLGSSTIAPGPALERARLMVASDHNDYGATMLFLASEARGGRTLTSYPFFFHAIFAGLFSPFSTFFTAVLDHYRIWALHLHPNSVLVLAIFSFYSGAFLGVRPSVAFFRCFFSVRRSSGATGPGCVGFRIGGGLVDWFALLGLPKKVDNLSRR